MRLRSNFRQMLPRYILIVLMLVTALLPGSASANSGTAGDPYNSLSQAHAAPASGRYFFNLGAGTFEADVDVSEGGGWVLVVQYVHAGGTNPPLNIIGAGANLPVNSTAALGANESADLTRWGHAGNAAMSQFTGDIETRWFARTSGNARTIHFRTSVGDDYFRSGTGSMSGVNSSFTALTGHNAFIPGTAGAAFSNQGNYAFTNFPFFEGAARHWGIAGANAGQNPATNGFRWEADDFPNSSANSTIHKVWVRAPDPRIVTTFSDSGVGSLREAINFANANPGADTIRFNIPGTGPHIIFVTSELPVLSGDGDGIDGTTQPGTSCGDLWAGVPPVLRIELIASSSAFRGIRLNGANQSVRGLSIVRFINKIETNSASTNAVIQCNFIGLRASGSPFTGSSVGLFLQGAGALVGGLNPGEGNVLSSNTQAVQTMNGSTDTAVRGNFIGTDPTGTIARSNNRGVNNLNGTATWRDITYNLIAGNAVSDISLDPDDTVAPSNGQILIQRNVIGYNRTQTAKLQVGTAAAILFDAGSITNVLIGGDASTQGNVIGSQQSGIQINTGSAISIQGNTVAGSGLHGILLLGGTGTAIGGTTAGRGNIIGANGGNGIEVRTAATNVSILGNTIGAATIAGSTAANGGLGIRVEATSNTIIGDGTSGGRNVIAGNGGRSIDMAGAISGLSINGNYIGTDASGNVAVASATSLSSSLQDAIALNNGGVLTSASINNNVIGGHGGAMIQIANASADGVTIQGNMLGVGANGTSQIVTGDVEPMINIQGVPRNYSNLLIGGSSPGQGNIIAYGAAEGIILNSTGSNVSVIGNTIRNNGSHGINIRGTTIASLLGNAIFNNGGLGIELGPDGVTLNDPGDADTGQNNLLNFPEFNGLNAVAGGDLAYAFTLDVPAEANGYRIDFYRNTTADPTGYGEGEQWLGFIDTPAHPGGAIAYSGTFTPFAPVSGGAFASATATRKTGASTYGETSEFNQNATIVTPLVVTNTNDAGAGSLRNAIDFANSDPAQDAITFNIPGSGVQTITLASVLPELTDDGISIDGTTQPGAACGDLWAGTPHTLLIRLDGFNRSFLGVTSAGPNHLIKGLSLTRFADGVRGSATSSNAVIQCNYIGLAPDGTSAANLRGVRTFGSNTLIGGLNADEGNVISAQPLIAISSGNTASGMAVRGNFIGTDPLGTAARPNGSFTISNQSGTASWSDITRNLISGNNNHGIDIQGDDSITASGSTIAIAGNFIGVDRTGTVALPNAGSGINFIQGTISNVTIGGTNAADRNVISGNGALGITMGARSNITILGNIVGLGADGDTTIGNVAGGINLSGTTNVQIGDGTAAGRNIVSGHAGQNGIMIDTSASNVTILGNYIGTDATGMQRRVNANGIAILGASGVMIGNGTVGGRNILSGNDNVGLLLIDGASAVTALGNYMGIGVDGFTAVRNNRGGIVAENVSNIQIGDGTAGGRNIISGNGDGVGGFDHGFFASSTTNLSFRGNYVGVAADGTSLVGNSINGMVFQSLSAQTGHDNTIVSNNVISGNGNTGVDISSFNLNNLGAASSMVFTGNKIGVAADGVTPAGNAAAGIKNTNVPGVIIIGGTNPGEGNIIAHNGGAGFFVESLPVTTALIGNSIHSNGGLGIDLGNDGVTPNDAGDGDSGPNNLLNFPQGIRAIAAGANTLNYSFTLDAPAAANGYRVEFFANDATDPSGHGEGQRYLGHIDISHAGGAQSYTGTLATLQPIAIGSSISITATRRTAGGSWDITSEFSATATADGIAKLTVEITSAPLEVSNPNAFATPGNDILLTATVTNIGDGGTDPDSLFAVIAISEDTSFFNGTAPGLGEVIGFSSGSPTLTFTNATDLRFSNSAVRPTAMGECNYTPASGYDPLVRFVCLNPKGTLPPGTPDGQFSAGMVVRIN